MDEQEWLRRIDEHLEVSKAYMREGHELMARNERAFLDLQSYLHEATIALRLMATQLRQSQREQNASWQEWREESRAAREESRAAREESRAESQANWSQWREESRVVREALFAILDKMNGAPPSAA